mmetsp:Transcript_54137/g.107769  ORF Transcript_54137/g.107769 Transcript_54137/m.107769 type:complete len:415 (-) Transcript_54137:71-1315(-)
MSARGDGAPKNEEKPEEPDEEGQQTPGEFRASDVQRHLERAVELEEQNASLPAPPTATGRWQRAASPGSLARLSRSELCQRLESQAVDLADLTRLVTPLKVENVRLSRSLKRACHLVQEVAVALRGFFADQSRREWFKVQKDEDPALVAFFKALVTWYKKICDDDNPTLMFYRRIWQYERGTGDEPSSTSNGLHEQLGTPASSRNGAARSSPALSSNSFYDACHARTENLMLQEENARLWEENSNLRRRVQALEREARGGNTPEVAGGLFGKPPSIPSLEVPRTSGVTQTPLAPFWGLPRSSINDMGGMPAMERPKRSQTRPPSPAARTLAQLAAIDPRWERLLTDPDRLFGGDDVIDQTYEQYLSDVLEMMERHGCTFKRGIELSEENQQLANQSAGSSKDGADMISTLPEMP